MHIYTYIGKWTTHNRDRKSLWNHKKSWPTAKGRRVRITKSTLLRSAKYDRWKFMQVNPEDVKLEEWRFRVGYERSPRQVVAGPLNAEGIARDRPTDRSLRWQPRVVQHCDTTTQLGQSGAVTKVADRGFSDTAVIVHLTVHRDLYENSCGWRAVSETVPRTKEPRARLLRFCARVAWPLSTLDTLPFFSFILSLFVRPFPPLVFSHCSPILRSSTVYSVYIFVYCSFTGCLSLILATPDGHACTYVSHRTVYRKHACTIRWMKRVSVSKQAPQRCHDDKAIWTWS